VPYGVHHSGHALVVQSQHGSAPDDVVYVLGVERLNLIFGTHRSMARQSEGCLRPPLQ
jgi:hypothetical protein